MLLSYEVLKNMAVFACFNKGLKDFKKKHSNLAQQVLQDKRNTHRILVIICEIYTFEL